MISGLLCAEKHAHELVQTRLALLEDGVVNPRHGDESDEEGSPRREVPWGVRVVAGWKAKSAVQRSKLARTGISSCAS